MRCATPTTIYAFTNTGSTRGTFNAVTISASDTTTCPSGQYLLVTQAEFDAGPQVVNPFAMTLAEAGPISGAVLLLWATGYGIRMLIQALRDGSALSSESSD